MEKIKKLNEELNYSKTIIEQLKSKIKELENKQNNNQSNNNNINKSLKEEIKKKDEEIDLLKKMEVQIVQNMSLLIRLHV